MSTMTTQMWDVLTRHRVVPGRRDHYCVTLE